MPPDHAREFGGGVAETTLNPIALLVLIFASVLVLVLPRRYAVLPLLAVTFLIPFSQVIVVGGSHFYLLRIVLLAGLARMVMAGRKNEPVLAGGYNSIDRAFLWCTLCQAICVVLLFGISALVNQVGFLLDFLGAYFILRHLIRDGGSVVRALSLLAVVCCVLAIAMIIEQVKLVNVFSLIGGSMVVPHIREGRIRSQGVFQHELTAGAFAATLIPLFFFLWHRKGSKFVATLGIAAATIMTITSNSSTSLLAYAAAILAVCLWPLRKEMQIIRRVIVAGILALAAVMKAPVWFIIAHIDLTGGSSGYHRAALIDQFIRHFGDWWLIGVKSTGNWGWDMWDAQNQFVNVGETGGLAALVLFIVMIVRCFSRLGKARKTFEGDQDPSRPWAVWFIGAALFSHIVAFFGVNYFDQARVAWLFLLAIVPVISTSESPVEITTIPIPEEATSWFISEETPSSLAHRESSLWGGGVRPEYL